MAKISICCCFSKSTFFLCLYFLLAVVVIVVVVVVVLVVVRANATLYCCVACERISWRLQKLGYAMVLMTSPLL